MSAQVHILNASKRLTPFILLIEKSINETLKEIGDLILVTDVDIVVADNPKSAIPEIGVGGFAPTAHLIYINIDPEYSGIEERLSAEIRSTLIHEFHHCARAKVVGYGETLLEAMVSEGLADHFELEITKESPKPWDIAVRGEDLDRLEIKAKLEFNSNKYDHGLWFFGTNDSVIPRWAGYSLGFKIVGNYLKNNNKKASELYGQKASMFLT